MRSQAFGFFFFFLLRAARALGLLLCMTTRELIAMNGRVPDLGRLPGRILRALLCVGLATAGLRDLDQRTVRGGRSTCA